MNIYMNKVSAYTFSCFDTGHKPSKQTESERFYHGFVLGLIVGLQGRYEETSNIRIYGFAFRGQEVFIDGGYLNEYDLQECSI